MSNLAIQRGIYLDGGATPLKKKTVKGDSLCLWSLRSWGKSEPSGEIFASICILMFLVWLLIKGWWGIVFILDTKVCEYDNLETG